MIEATMREFVDRIQREGLNDGEAPPNRESRPILNNIEVSENSEEFENSKSSEQRQEEAANTLFEDEVLSSLGEEENYVRKLPRIAIKIGSKVGQALVNTGASVNFIGASVLENRDLSELPNSTTVFLGCQNNTRHSLGHIELEVKIEGREYVQTFTVLEHLNEDVLKVMKTDETAYIPTRASCYSAGCDLRTPEDFSIPARERLLVDSLLKIQLPPDVYGRIAPRSGLALKFGIDIFAGVIDQDYRGTIKILLYNSSSEEVYFKRGDKIAQLICEQFSIPLIREVDSLSTTERGERGFGSSDIPPK
ncbi:hypothetical protein JTB14_028719 [Gonioctena quinquepunctata]|nr:hypothetical protein JTB14_028719 [Gonioctena quinquepunctata]